MIFGVTKLLKEKSNSEPTNPFSPAALDCRGRASACSRAAAH